MIPRGRHKPICSLGTAQQTGFELGQSEVLAHNATLPPSLQRPGVVQEVDPPAALRQQTRPAPHADPSTQPRLPPGQDDASWTFTQPIVGVPLPRQQA
jgi:hypothetical protein